MTDAVIMTKAELSEAVRADTALPRAFICDMGNQTDAALLAQRLAASAQEYFCAVDGSTVSARCRRRSGGVDGA